MMPTQRLLYRPSELRLACDTTNRQFINSMVSFPRCDGHQWHVQSEISLKIGAIVLMAEAEGYVPALSEPLTASHSASKSNLRKEWVRKGHCFRQMVNPLMA
jgi:hypothetical protein